MCFYLCYHIRVWNNGCFFILQLQEIWLDSDRYTRTPCVWPSYTQNELSNTQRDSSLIIIIYAYLMMWGQISRKSVGCRANNLSVSPSNVIPTKRKDSIRVEITIYIPLYSYELFSKRRTYHSIIKYIKLIIFTKLCLSDSIGIASLKSLKEVIIPHTTRTKYASNECGI